MVRREVTGGMKRFFAAVMVLLLVVTLSGCKEVPSFMPGFWDGLTKLGAEEYVQNTPQEKYGEEFVVTSMGIHSGQYYRELVGTCSPKSDENIAFEFEVNHFSENRTMKDNHIQNVVRKQLKQNIDEVLSTHYDNFASEVYVTPLTKWYDSGMSSASETTVKTFSETFAQNGKDDKEEFNKTSVWIILSNNEPADIDKLNSIIQEMTLDFYSLNVYIDCFFADQDTINLCNEKANSTDSSRWDVQVITRNGNFRWDRFIY